MSQYLWIRWKMSFGLCRHAGMLTLCMTVASRTLCFHALLDADHNRSRAPCTCGP